MMESKPISFPYAERAATYARAAYEGIDGFRKMVGADEGDEVAYVNVEQGPLDVQAYTHTHHRTKTIWVAIRGTESSKWDDWLQNLRFRAALPHNPGLGGIHRGFLAEARAVAKPIAAAIFRSPGYQVIMTGHSKGGSICTVLQHVWNITAICHTFGECRSLTRKAAGIYRHRARRHFRWVNTIDPVPRLLWWRYRHIGALIYFDRDGKRHIGFARAWDRLFARIRKPWGGVERHAMDGYLGLVRRSVSTQGS